MFKNALVSVSDKSGLIEFIKPLAMAGMRVVSTGGTAKHLREHGIAVVDVSEQTKFPEVMDGRVKTLNPRVHMALLARLGNAEDEHLLQAEGLQPFDLVVGNLYPFAQTAIRWHRGEVDADELIENIDIGGPSFLRAAAKNFSRVAVVCDPRDYAWIAQKQTLDERDRKKLAAKVFAHTSTYDSAVAEELGNNWQGEWSLAGRAVMDLRYGENPHQAAAWFRKNNDEHGLHSAQVLQGKPLSYNNILDLDAAALLARSLKQNLHLPSVVAVKHNNPCGAAVAPNLAEAMQKALRADPTSVFGGIVACSETVTAEVAMQLNEVFLECVVAPDFTSEALEVFARKKNLRLLQWKGLLQFRPSADVRSVAGGFLVQEPDQQLARSTDWKFLGEQPSAQVLLDLQFAELVGASLKSNAICLVKDGQTLGLGMGQVNRVEAVQHAVDRMHQHHGKIERVIMASDAFFPFADSIEIAAKNGVQWVLQPGGSIKDTEVFAAAKNLGLQMVITGTRHFRH